MKIKTATKIAIYGTITAALMGIAYPYIIDYFVAAQMTGTEAKRFVYAYDFIRIVAGAGSLLVFLFTLASKQKD